jgi:DNA-directed RNA polymerase subunit RPC12/RpoP
MRLTNHLSLGHTSVAPQFDSTDLNDKRTFTKFFSEEAGMAEEIDGAVPGDKTEVIEYVFHCPNCGAEIPEKAYRAMMEKMARGEPTECDYCPY